MKIDKEIFKIIGGCIGIGCVLIFLVIMVYGMQESKQLELARDQYCKDLEWEGVEASTIHRYENYCYKNVPHKSGVGTKMIYSGDISKIVYEEWVNDKEKLEDEK